MRPSPHTAAGASQAQRGTAFFFATALGVTWALQLPAVLAQYGVIAGGVERYMLPAALGGFGPLLAAVLAARRERRRSSASSPFAALRVVRVPARWYLAALLGFTAVHAAGTAIYKLIVAGSVVFSWLYNHTRGSLLLAVIAHAGAHLSNPTHALPENVTPFLVYTASMCGAAVALVLTDRRVFGVAARQQT